MVDAKKNIHFSALDALRGFAATLVAVFHFNSGWAGYLAVDFFLVLSGFIIAHVYFHNKRDTSFSEFVSHRVARLYPLHIYTLFTFIITFFIINGTLPVYEDGTLFTFIQNLTLTNNVGLNPSKLTYNSPSWSISVELWVNIIFFLAVALRTRLFILSFISVILFAIIYENTGHLDTHFANYYGIFNSGLLRGIASFSLGIISHKIYLVFEKNKNEFSVNNIFHAEVALLIAIVFVVFARDDKFSSLDFLAPFLFTIVVSLFALERGYLSKFLIKFRYLGEISYSIYLNQVTVLLIIREVASDLNPIIRLVIFLTILLVYSSLTYNYIEKPLRKKGRNLLLLLPKKRAKKV